MIRRICEAEYPLAYSLMIESFMSITDQYDITPINCPGYSGFLTYPQFLKEMNKIELYGFFGESLIGCIGLVRKSDVSSKIKMLSVKPIYRHKGIGKCLVDFLEDLVKGKITLGMIYENQQLFNWYLQLGYELKKTKQYRGNKFHIAYMEKRIEKNI